MNGNTAVSSKFHSGRRVSVFIVASALAAVFVSPITKVQGYNVAEHRGFIQIESTVKHAIPISNLPVIELNKPIAHQLSTTQPDQYRVTLAANQYLELAVEQRGIDVGIRFFSADDKKLADINRVKGTKGSEALTFVADASGDFRIEVRSTENNASPGLYGIQIVALRESTADERTLEQARRLSEESRLLRQDGKYDAAIEPAARALSIREKLLGPNHIIVADSVQSLASIYDDKEDYTNAEPLFTRALTVRESVLGPDHPDVARSLISLAWVYSVKQDYAKSEAYYQRGLAIQERALGPEHSEIATTLNDLGLLYFETGEYDKSIETTRRVLAIRERTAGPETDGAARALNNIALAMIEKGDYADAEALLRRGLPIAKKVFGPEHPQVSFWLDNLARAVMDQGNYSEAEQLYKQALVIREKAFGTDHPRVAETLHSMAFLYRLKGDFDKSNDLFRRSADMSEKSLGADHRDVATSLSQLARNLIDQGNYAEADPIVRRALAIREKARNQQHPDLAYSLAQLGMLYLNKRDYSQAEPLFRRSLAILEKSLGSEQPPIALPLSNLAAMFESKGDPAQAEGLYRRALAIQEKQLGPHHSDVAQTLDALARVARVRCETTRALEMLGRVNEIREYNFAHNLPLGSERQQLSYLKLFGADIDNALSLHAELAPTDTGALRLAFTTLLRRKGRGLDAMSNNVADLRRRANPQDQELFNKLFDVRSQLAALTLNPPQKHPELYGAQVKRIEAELDRLEAEISTRSAEFRSQSVPITLEAIQSVIPADAALVEFALYQPTNEKSQTRYSAYVLTSAGAPRWLDIGPATQINDALNNWRKALRDPARTDVNRLARVLGKRLMQPVLASIGSAQHLLISPDGPLNLVPFAALVDERDNYLVERYNISYLTSGRDLLRLQIPRDNKNASVVVADPAFGQPALATSRGSLATSRVSNSAGPARLDYSQIFFGPLPGVTAEVRALRTILPKATFLTGEQATKSAVRSLSGPSTLHIATHGFFLQEVGDNSEKPGMRTEATRIARWVARVDNPLLRSGLALAGANNDGEDGVLTALEAAGLDLWGTRLVVLSACDTGIGEVKNGDGVYGLRRALVLAGAESQVMSLWPVSDRSTAQLMTGYYKSLTAGKGRGEALRQVQLQMLRETTHKHPYYWASFIQSGEWANLQGIR